MKQPEKKKKKTTLAGIVQLANIGILKSYITCHFSFHFMADKGLFLAAGLQNLIGLPKASTL